jgi:hypothetical protein
LELSQAIVEARVVFGSCTVDEAVDYIKSVSIFLFKRDEIGFELAELDRDYELYKKGQLILNMDVILKEVLEIKKKKGHFE